MNRCYFCNHKISKKTTHLIKEINPRNKKQKNLHCCEICSFYMVKVIGGYEYK